MAEHLVVPAEPLQQRPVVRDAAEKHQPLGVEVARLSFRPDRLHPAVGGLGEVELLLLPHPERLSPALLFLVLYEGRALGDYHDVRAPDPGRKVPQFAYGQQVVPEDRPVPVYQHYGYVRGESPVLQRIVEHYQLRRLHFPVPAFAGASVPAYLLRVAEQRRPVHPVLVHSHGHIGELALDLQRLVAEVLCAAVHGNLLETTAFPLISPGEHSQRCGPEAKLFRQQPQQQLRMRRLSRPAYGHVAYRNGRHLGPDALSQPLVVEGVPYFQRGPVGSQQHFVYRVHLLYI